MVNESRVFVFIVNLVVFKLELAIDKVTQVGRVIGQVVLLKQVDKIIKVQLHSVILQRKSYFTVIADNLTSLSLNTEDLYHFQYSALPSVGVHHYH